MNTSFTNRSNLGSRGDLRGQAERFASADGAAVRSVARAAVRSVLMTVLAVVSALSAATHAGGQCPPGDWVPGIGTPGTDGFGVRALAVLPNGDVIAGGSFRTAGGVAVNNIARHDPAAGTWSRLGTGTNGSVFALAVLPGGDVIAGGEFSAAGDVAARGIARCNPTTGVWSALGSGVSGGPLGFLSVRALAVVSTGDVIVGGYFTTAGGVAVNNIARYNPATGLWSTLGSGVSGGSYPGVYALACLPGGDVIASGTFERAGAVSVNYIARYSPATETWSSLGAGLDNPIAETLAVLPGGDVVVGGLFLTADGVAVNNIARYNPTTKVWSALGQGISEFVWSLAILPGGDLIAGGYFFRAGGMIANSIARFDFDTGIWSALGSGRLAGLPPGPNDDSYALSLAVLPDGDVIVGGHFFATGALPANNIARYYPGATAASILAQPQETSACFSGSAAFSITAAGDGPLTYQWRRDTVVINTLANPSAATAMLMLTDLQPADAGSYGCIITNACGSATSDPATLTICIGDFNCDGGIDGADVGAFFDAWEAGNPAADVNADGGIDKADVEYFFRRWENGF